MITRMFRELEEEYSGYGLHERDLALIREKMEEVAYEFYWEGFKDGDEGNLPKVERKYGRKEDQES